MDNNVEIFPATIEYRPVMHHLMHLYLYDFSEYTQDDVDDEGLFVDENLDRYWREPNRYAFLVKMKGKYAGFIMVRDISEEPCEVRTHSIAEFFVIKKYRRHRLGQYMAVQTFNHFPGRWKVAQEELNVPAQHFWRKVIGEYTGRNFQEVREPDWHGPIQVFMTPDR